ncbi:MAG: pyridoxamine 5'-phosphate oxidase family protein [Raoultibacter sp.]
MEDIKSTIAAILEKKRIVYISSVDADGFPNTKAMLAPRKHDGIKVFHFHTNTHSRRVSQYKQNPHASLYFCDELTFKGVMLVGTMEVLEDSAHKEMLWQESDTLYYSLGVTDPDYCVLKFTASKGRYYSNFSSEDFEVE